MHVGDHYEKVCARVPGRMYSSGWRSWQPLRLDGPSRPALLHGLVLASILLAHLALRGSWWWRGEHDAWDRGAGVRLTTCVSCNVIA
jgi:hypothetical protein